MFLSNLITQLVAMNFIILSHTYLYVDFFLHLKRRIERRCILLVLPIGKEIVFTNTAWHITLTADRVHRIYWRATTIWPFLLHNQK